MKTLTKFGLAAAAAFTFFATDVAAQAISTATVTVNPISKAPTGLTASIAGTSVIESCSGTSITLTVTGGSLAPGASWKFYRGSIAPANEIAVTATADPSVVTATLSNTGLTNETSDILVRAEGGTTCNVTTDDAALSFTVLPLPNGSLADLTVCEDPTGVEYKLTFTATTPIANGPFDLEIALGAASGFTYADQASGVAFKIDDSQLPSVGANSYNLVKITDGKGCVKE